MPPRKNVESPNIQLSKGLDEFQTGKLIAALKIGGGWTSILALQGLKGRWLRSDSVARLKKPQGPSPASWAISSHPVGKLKTSATPAASASAKGAGTRSRHAFGRDLRSPKSAYVGRLLIELCVIPV